MSGVDPAWEELSGTPAGRYFRMSRDIVVAVPVPGFQQTEESAQRSLEAFDSIARAAGRKQSVIVLVDRVASQDAKARRVWSRTRPEETRSAQALVCGTLLARAIGSFFLGLNKGAVPTRMFPDLESAREWAQRMADEHGGPIE